MISPKQQKIIAFPYSKYDALICDGAVRSGKTSIMMWAFVRWAMENFSGQRFGVCGRTVDSCTKNIIVPFTAMSLAKERYIVRWRRGDKVMEVRRGAVTNYFEVFGGKDEASYTLIQGRTLAGVLLDEVVLMPRSFVEQALARCSVDGAKLWFSCNPGSPHHWFYREWIVKATERKALYIHFSLEDNPALSRSIIARYKRMYSGDFYRRFILGQWVIPAGRVYDFFDESMLCEVPENCTEHIVSCDYGTKNPSSFGLWGRCGGEWYRLREYYYDSRKVGVQKTASEYVEDLKALCGDIRPSRVIVDPSAASFIEALTRCGFKVEKADNDVVSGIRLTASLLKSGKIKICRGCDDALREFYQYRWDEKAGKDAPLKQFDHAMDDIRYFAVGISKAHEPIGAVWVER